MENKRKESPQFIDRLSILSAVILLSYALIPFVNIPEIRNTWTLFGIQLVFNINFSTYISILVPALAAVGTYWLIETHPNHRNDRYPLLHSILPAVTSWIIGLPFTQVLSASQSWIVFALEGVLMIVIFIAEYTVVDPNEERYLIAAGILKSLSLALFRLLAISVRSAGLRLYVQLPALVIPMILVLLRTFYLQLEGRWLISWSFGISLMMGQISIILHYLPISPVIFGLLETAVLYAAIEFVSSYQQDQNLRRSLLAPAFIMVFFSLLIIIV